MKNLVVCSCVADDKYAPISMYLMQYKLDDVVAGVEKYAADNQAEILYLLPSGTTIDGLGSQIRYSETSPVLSNSYAVAQVLAGNLPRPMIQDDFLAVYDDKAVLVLTPETAYGIKNGFSSRFIAVNIAGKTEIVEAAIGTSLAEIADVKDAKAVLVGGLKGKFIAGSELKETKITGEDMYSSITVYSKENCIVDVCKTLASEAYQSSCGKCVLCREGTSQFKQIISEMTTGRAKATDISLLKEVGELVCIGSYCPFGQNMPRPMLSALELFAEEFEEHIKKKKCRCGVCYKAECTYIIRPDMCTGCGDCMEECEEDAIEGKKGFIHMIDQDMCEQCGKCVASCEEDAIVAVTGKLPRLPKRLTKVGKF